MKYLPAQIAYFVQTGSTRRNLRLLLKFFAVLVVMVGVYSVAFHLLMAREGQDYSWVTGVYWTLTVMSTLGFGDITFESDAGRVFSILVLLSGIIFLLVVLPFTFIQFFYAPWLEATSRQRAPRQVPHDAHGHVILTNRDAVSMAFIERLGYHGRQYYVLEPNLARALEMHDAGLSVILGAPDDIDTYRRVRAPDAALIAATGDDYANTNIAFTVRELTSTVPVVTFARAPESVDVLELAGSSHVIQLTEMLGRSLARRTLGGIARANVVGRFGDLLIAEAPAFGTPLVGRSIAKSGVREATGLTIVGLWERGHFEAPSPDTLIHSTTVLVLAGSEAQLAELTELMAIYSPADAPVLILGGGRVGRAAGQALAEREILYRIVEKDPSRVRDGARYVVGNAADLGVLESAGIREAPSTIVTTNDDATNIYLTNYCRRLRPDMQIISRATLERNISTLHRAGADFVMSYASMGANTIYNLLEGGDVVMLAEGLDVFRCPVPKSLAGRTLAETNIRSRTGCSVVAIEQDGRVLINPAPDSALPGSGTAELILIGTTEGERRFLERYGDKA